MDPRVERTRARVIEAAQELILEGGPAAVTYSALAARSGVGRATIYRHWPDLDAFWPELMGDIARQAQAELVGDLSADLHAAMVQMVRLLERQGQRSTLITMLERAQWDPLTRGFIDGMEAMTPIRLALELAAANGQLPEDLGLDVATSLLMGPLLHRALMTSHDVDERFGTAIVRAFLAAHGRRG